MVLGLDTFHITFLPPVLYTFDYTGSCRVLSACTTLVAVGVALGGFKPPVLPSTGRHALPPGLGPRCVSCRRTTCRRVPMFNPRQVRVHHADRMCRSELTSQGPFPDSNNFLYPRFSCLSVCDLLGSCDDRFSARCLYFFPINVRGGPGRGKVDRKGC